MPLTHIRTFRVRHYECDLHGYVRGAAYLRYMQEAAFDASAAAGYDLSRYEAIGYFWLVRETELAVLRPLRYGDTVAITTYVADFRRVRSRRAYEFHLAGTHEPVAMAHTDWAFLDHETQRPAQIPDEMKAAFFPEGVPDTSPPRERFPDAPAAPPGVVRTWRRVEWRDLDAAGHVNNAVYLAYLEEAAWHAASTHGWPPSRLAALGLSLTARQCRIEYHQPALLGDELELATWLSDLSADSAVRHYTLTRVADQALVARARVVWGAMNVETGNPGLLPEGFLSVLAPNTSDVGSPGH